MAEILGVVQFTVEALEPKDAPPLAAANHSILPAEAVAFIEAVPVPHLEAPVEPVMVGSGVTVIFIAAEYSTDEPLQEETFLLYQVSTVKAPGE